LDRFKVVGAKTKLAEAMYKMFNAEYEPPQSKLYAELEGEQASPLRSPPLRPVIS